MKKFYFLTAMALFGSYSFGQSKLVQQTYFTGKTKPGNTNYTPKALGQTIWEDNFDNPGDWQIDNDGITAVDAGWAIDPNVDSWYFSDPNFGGPTTFNSTSGGNFAELNNGDDPNAVAATNATYTITTTNPIDIVALGGSQFVELEFLQHGARFNDDQAFYISEDGTNFVRVGDNSDQEVLSNTGGSPYDNPDEVRINLSQYLSANPTQVWIRFEWTSAFPGNTANIAWVTYGWMIDDVKINTLSDNDVVTNDVYHVTNDLTYYQIPENQVAPIDFSVAVENNGSNGQTGVALEATETLGSGYTGVSPAVSLPFQGTDSLVVSNSFTPPGIGSYNVDFAILNDAVDDVPSNNIMDSYSFDVGQYIYARDIGTATGSFSGTISTPAVTIEPGNLFEIFANDDLYAIDAVLGSTVGAGIDVYGTLYEIDVNTGDFVFLQETEIYTTGANDANAELTLSFATPQTLDAGKTYLITVSSFSTDFSVATGGIVPDQTSFIYGDLGTGGIAWYYINDAPMVRMNFDPCPPSFTNLSVSITDPYCVGSCDAVVEDTDPAFSTYEYTWYDNNNNLLFTGQQFTNVCAGDYYVIKTDNNCGGGTDQISFTVNEPSSVVLASSFNNQQASNCTSADGVINMTIDFAASFSSNDLTIEVNGPSNETINTPQSASYSIPGLLPGNYTVTVTDNENGCDPWVFNTTVTYDLTSEQTLCVVTVDSANTNQNMIVWEKPADISFIDSFFVHREITTNNYQKIGAVHVDSLSQFADASANPNSTAYRYKISVLDVCGQELDLSPYHNTIHLQFQGNGNFNWNQYQIEGATNVIDSYNFYKDPQSDGNWQVIQVIPGSQNTYTDVDFNNTPNASYYVDVNWLGGASSCQPTKAQGYNSSRSNEFSASNVSLDDYDESNITIRPNPTSAFLFIENIEQLSQIEIVNAVGQSVYSSEGKNEIKVDVSAFGSGVYIVRIKTNEGLIQKRFVKP